MMVRISAPVYPSEDPEKVRDAMLRIFPDAAIEKTDGGMEGSADGLENFTILIRKQKILDTARSVMLKGRNGGRTEFRINKQVAFSGKISFTEERTVLGAIKVTVDDESILDAIDRTAPATADGEEIQ